MILLLENSQFSAYCYTQRILKSTTGIVAKLEANVAHEVHDELDNDEGDEAKDPLAAHDLQWVDVVLGDKLLLVDKLAGSNNLTPRKSTL